MNKSLIAALLAASAVAWLPASDAIAAGSDVILELAQATPMADGEVRRIDKEQGKVTLRHGPIPSLDMGAMSMVFRVKDPAMLDRMSVGQKIRFEAAKVDGQLTVMRYEPVN